MRKQENKILRGVFYGILILFLLNLGSCEKEERCLTCYRVNSSGIVPATKTTMCGETGIQHLRDRGYLCR